MVSPLPVCSDAGPCTRPLLGAVITEAARAPLCRTTANGRPFFDDGPPLTRTGIDGTTRYACFYLPPAASAAAPRPLLIWFHGSGGTSDGTYDTTRLRAKAETYDVSGDAGRPGFALLSIQGRNLHWPTLTPEDGPKHDLYYRDFGSPSTNPDFANVDAFIDELTDAGRIDPARVYVSGWSNGARFAQSYAIARHDAGTPGGHHVRAAAVYSGTDPFNTPNPGLVPECRMATYPRSNVPIYVVSRTCDILPCNQAMANAFVDAGTDVTPGDVMEVWINQLRTQVQNPNVTWQRLTTANDPVNFCSSTGLGCTPNLGLLNHINWPDGQADGGGDHEPAMLDFLSNAP
jgi:poly(3-hydroxybutyrate) depolymerase